MDDGAAKIEDTGELEAVRKQARRVVRRAFAIAAVVTAAIVAWP